MVVVFFNRFFLCIIEDSEKYYKNNAEFKLCIKNTLYTMLLPSPKYIFSNN